MTLREFASVRQEPGCGKRRYFSAGTTELMVWYQKGADQIDGFQICYIGDAGEKAMTWRCGVGYYHNGVSSRVPFSFSSKGTVGCAGRIARMPILTPNGTIPREKLLKQFIELSADMEPELRYFIVQKLIEAPTG